MSKPPLTAPVFHTITDADWCREIQLARARGERDGNMILARIRAAVARHSLVEDANLPKKATDGAGPGAKIGQ